MALDLIIPEFSYKSIRQIADSFLSKHHPERSLPVPIEQIAEIQFGLNIIPVPGLQKAFDVDAFISRDLASVTVDQFILERRPNRYRFSLAHELGHLELHRDVFKQLEFSSVEDWKKLQQSIGESDYGWLEWQAYAFAGLTLVPPSELAKIFAELKGRASEVGLDLQKTGEVGLAYVSNELAARFGVSKEVIERRLTKDGLWKIQPE